VERWDSPDSKMQPGQPRCMFRIPAKVKGVYSSPNRSVGHWSPSRHVLKLSGDTFLGYKETGKRKLFFITTEVKDVWSCKSFLSYRFMALCPKHARVTLILP